ncbi:MAG: hypothetical protein IJ760_06020 [Bacteroidales bacterium]|nr:hypothetical protein [Bacteroidales bacterium]
MKKVTRIAIMAVAVMGLAVACKSKEAKTVDTLPAEPVEQAVDSMIDEMNLDTIAAEVEKEVQQVKSATKAAATKAAEKVDPHARGNKAASSSSLPTVSTPKVSDAQSTTVNTAPVSGGTNKVDPHARR